MSSETVEPDEPADRVPRGRSPSYPGIPLSTAIQRAKTIYEHAQQHPVPLAKITGRWGYKAPTTGPASVTYAALKKYGLLEDQGSGSDRVGRLTDLAVEILHPNPGQEDAIRRSALTPSIHREWWERYGNDLPPDDSLHWEYVVKGPFTEKGFREFLRVYRETVHFAKLDTAAPSGWDQPDDDSMLTRRGIEPQSGPSDRTAPEPERGPGAETPDALMSYPIPVAAGVNVVIQGRFPLTDVEWAQFLAVLNAMKPALTQSTAESPREGASPEATE